MEKKPEGERLRIINNSWRTLMCSRGWLSEHPFLAQEHEVELSFRRTTSLGKGEVALKRDMLPNRECTVREG